MRLYAGGRTSRTKPAIICFPSHSDSPSCLVTRDQVERVRGPLSRGVILLRAQPLFSRLQRDLRFFHPPIPAGPSACLTARFPKGRPTGLPRSVPVPSAWFRFRLSAGGTSSAIGECRCYASDEHLYLTPYLQAFQPVRLVSTFGLSPITTFTLAPALQVQVSAVYIC